MRINERRLTSATVLELHGDLASQGAGDHLIAAVRNAAHAPANGVILDLDDVPFVDAGGIGALLGAYGEVTRVGGTFRLARVRSRVRALLAVCRLVPPFEAFHSVEDAAAHDMMPPPIITLLKERGDSPLGQRGRYVWGFTNERQPPQERRRPAQRRTDH